MIDRVTLTWRQLAPAVRLTVAYMAIVMLISIVFSVALYNLSANQLGDSLQRQYNRFNTSPLFYHPPGGMQIEDEVREGLDHLKVRLIYFNLVILVVGSAASYWLAKRTLRPIEAALESQSRFTADASHELRTPLTAMQTEIEVALRNKQLTQEEALALLRSNLEEVAKLRGLSDGLLQLAQGKASPRTFTTVHWDDIAGAAARRVGAAAKQRGIKIINETEPTVIIGDAPALTEVATILLDNAVKYCAPKAEVTLRSYRHGAHGIFEVRDTGPGIKASDVPHIFDRFYRSDRSRTKEQVDGYGLGLSIAKQITEIHHGYIEVSSTLGRGSIFTVAIPTVKE